MKWKQKKSVKNYNKKKQQQKNNKTNLGKKTKKICWQVRKKI